MDNEPTTVEALAAEYNMQPYELRAFADLAAGPDAELLGAEVVEMIREAIKANPSTV